MAIVDMPLSELQNYQGINPRPANFDNCWKKTLKEIDATASAIKFKPADCFAMYFTGVKDTRVYAKGLA